MITEILCRFDALKQAPVVFLSDTINGKQIQAWSGEGKPAYVPLDYYHMTAPLSVADEKVLMERFKQATGKQDMVVNIRHRLPRNNRPLPNLLANAASATDAQNMKDITPKRKAGAMRIEDQKAPEAPQGVPTPEEGLVPAAPIQALVAAPVAPTADGLQSTAIWNKIEQLNARVQQLTATVTFLTTELQAASVDLETTKTACQQVISEYNEAIEAEANEALRKRQEMIAQLTAQVTPVTPVAEAPQAAPVTTTREEATGKSKPRGNGGKFVGKSTAAKSAQSKQK